MAFTNRTQFTESAASEKLILAHVNAVTRLVTWTLDSGAIYKRQTTHFVNALKKNDVDLTRVATLGDLAQGTFYYDIFNSTLYTWLDDSSDPQIHEMIVEYRLFFANNPISLPWNFDPTESDVYYSGRILENPGFKHKIGIDQQLTSTIGSGTLKLENNDAELDSIFDRFIFENKEVKIYSWHRDLGIEEAKVIFIGKITDKTYTSSSISFTIKDAIFDLNENVPQGVFTEDDNVNTDTQGNYKRWIYGRVDGLKAQSIDQIRDGYSITGTVSFNTESVTMTGNGTLFLNETSPGDTLTVETLEFKIEEVVSDTEITLSKTPDYAVSGLGAIIMPNSGVVTKNREFFVADHACALVTKQVIEIKQFNRIVLSDTVGLESGDFIEFTTGERREIKNIAPGNIIVLRQNVGTLPTISSYAIRRPIQQVYVSGTRLVESDYTINTTPSKTTISLTETAEFNIAPVRDYSFSLDFVNGSRTVNYSGSQPLTEFLSTNDWIRPSNLTYTTYYQILSVSDTNITLRSAFSEASITDTIQAKQPNYIIDDTIVSCDVLGRTEDNTPSGTWIRTSAQVVKDLLSNIGITNINTSTFSETSDKVNQLISMTLPSSPGTESTTIKEAIDRINKSTRCALTLDSNLSLQYKSIIVSAPEEFTIIKDSDVIRWSIKSTNGKNYRYSTIRYRHQDVDRNTLEPGNNVSTASSEFVSRYIGNKTTFQDDFYIYNSTAAKIAAEREIYYNSLGRSEISVESDLRLESVDIGDLVLLDFDRLYKRFGDITTRRKLVACVGKTVTGERIKLDFSDYGNTYNTSAFITSNTANGFNLSDSDDKIKNGYITDENSIVDNDEETNKTNLIS